MNRKIRPVVSLFTALLLLFSFAYPHDKSEEELDYRIEKPGTITFTVGLQIMGKVDKPQVMIFLPKERTVFREIELSRSFSERIMEPFSFEPVNE